MESDLRQAVVTVRNKKLSRRALLRVILEKEKELKQMKTLADSLGSEHEKEMSELYRKFSFEAVDKIYRELES